MFDCVGYVFGSGLVFYIDKKKKKEREKKKVKTGSGAGGRKSRIELHLLFLICRLWGRGGGHS